MESILWLLGLFLLVVTITATWNWLKHRHSVNQFRSTANPTDEQRMAHIRRMANQPDTWQEWSEQFARSVSVPGYAITGEQVRATFAPYLRRAQQPGDLDAWLHELKGQTLGSSQSQARDPNLERMRRIQEKSKDPVEFRAFCAGFAKDLSSTGIKITTDDIAETLLPYLSRPPQTGDWDDWQHDIDTRASNGIDTSLAKTEVDITASPEATGEEWRRGEFERHWKEPHTNEALLWWSLQIEKDPSMVDAHLAALKFYALKTGKSLLAVLPNPNTYKGQHWWKQQVSEDPDAEVVMNKVIDFHRNEAEQ